MSESSSLLTAASALGTAPGGDPTVRIATELGIVLTQRLQFLHLEKAYGFFPDVNDRVVAAMYGLDVATYLAARKAFEDAAGSAAVGLLEDSAFAAQVDGLPFRAGQTVAAVGDSITDDLQSWFAILRHLVDLRGRAPGIRWINNAVSGDTTQQAMAGFLNVALAQPDWVIFLLGTNDARAHGLAPLKSMVSLDETERNLRALRHFATSQTGAKLVWMTPPPAIEAMIGAHWNLGTRQLAWRNADLAAIGAAIARLSDPVVDLFPVFGQPTDPALLLSDGLHPSLAGQARIARALVAKLAG